MSLKADLYLNRTDPLRYMRSNDCEQCGFSSCSQWLEKLKRGEARLQDCPTLEPGQSHALQVFLSLGQLLPDVEITQHPVAGATGRLEINEPGPDSPLLVTGNAIQTEEVVLAVLSTTEAPFHLLFVDTQGHTVDMALIYRTFTAEAVVKALVGSGLDSLLSHKELIIPGLAAQLKSPLERMSGWKVTVGPVCIGELPLFFGSGWSRPSEKKSQDTLNSVGSMDLPGSGLERGTR